MPKKGTLCWSCDNAFGGCSWSRESKPVPGWMAERRDIKAQRTVNGEWEPYDTESYFVRECPVYVSDRRRR